MTKEKSGAAGGAPRRPPSRVPAPLRSTVSCSDAFAVVRSRSPGRRAFPRDASAEPTARRSGAGSRRRERRETRRSGTPPWLFPRARPSPPPPSACPRWRSARRRNARGRWCVWRVRCGIETRAVTRRRDATTGTRGTRRVRPSAEMRWFAPVRESRASPYLPRTRERRRGVRLDALRRGPRSRRRRRPEQVHRVVVAPAHHAVGTADLDAW